MGREMSDTRQRTDKALELLRSVSTADELLRWEDRAVGLISECSQQEADEIGQAILDKMREIGLFKRINR